MVMVTTCRHESRLRAEALRELKTEYSTIEVERSVQIRHFQMHMSDRDTRGDDMSCRSSHHSLFTANPPDPDNAPVTAYAATVDRILTETEHNLILRNQRPHSRVPDIEHYVFSV